MTSQKICPKCGAIADWDSYFGGTRCTKCDFVERLKPTNYDRVTRKTPEEMAKFLAETQYNAYVRFGWRNTANWLAWLKQEATE